VSHDLVDRVVPPHVLAQDQQPALEIEQRRRVKATGALEGRLRGGQGRGDPGEQRGGHRGRRDQRSGGGADRLDRDLPTHAARRRRDQAAPEALARDVEIGLQDHVDHVPGVGLPVRTAVVADDVDALGRANDALGVQEPGDQILVVPGGAHRDRERHPAQPDLQWLFDRQVIGRLGGRVVANLQHRQRYRGGAGGNVEDNLWAHGHLPGSHPTADDDRGYGAASDMPRVRPNEGSQIRTIDDAASLLRRAPESTLPRRFDREDGGARVASSGLPLGRARSARAVVP
jgi:hypothetical protein